MVANAVHAHIAAVLDAHEADWRRIAWSERPIGALDAIYDLRKALVGTTEENSG